MALFDTLNMLSMRRPGNSGIISVPNNTYGQPVDISGEGGFGARFQKFNFTPGRSAPAIAPQAVRTNAPQIGTSYQPGFAGGNSSGVSLFKDIPGNQLRSLLTQGSQSNPFGIPAGALAGIQATGQRMAPGVYTEQFNAPIATLTPEQAQGFVTNATPDLQTRLTQLANMQKNTNGTPTSVLSPTNPTNNTKGPLQKTYSQLPENTRLPPGSQPIFQNLPRNIIIQG